MNGTHIPLRCVDKPVKTFSGKIAAIIHRNYDVKKNGSLCPKTDKLLCRK